MSAPPAPESSNEADLRAILAHGDIPDEIVETAAALTRMAMSPRRDIGPPSKITSIYTWVDELCNDTRQRIPFENRVAEARPEWAARLEVADAHPRWPQTRTAVARLLVDDVRHGEERLKRLIAERPD